MKRIAPALAVLALALIALAACTDPCKDAADKIAACHKAFCDKYATAGDQAKMNCQMWSYTCPNGESLVCGLDIDRCSRDNAVADPFLDGDCDEMTGQISVAAQN